jgi:hypothetical protein
VWPTPNIEGIFAMRQEPGLGRFRTAVLAIAAMIVVSGVGAISSYLLIDNNIAIDRVASWPSAHDDQDCWLCPDDALGLFVSGQLLADWSGLMSADHPDAVDAAEITFPILTVLAVVATAQRLSESRRG